MESRGRIRTYACLIDVVNRQRYSYGVLHSFEIIVSLTFCFKFDHSSLYSKIVQNTVVACFFKYIFLENDLYMFAQFFNKMNVRLKKLNKPII